LKNANIIDKAHTIPRMWIVHGVSTSEAMVDSYREIHYVRGK
jgi:hypothetical protein